MRALLYSEWAIIRSSIKQYLVVTVIMASVIGVMSVTLVDVVDAASVATNVYTSVVSTVTIMLTFFVFFALFGADEREGWETARLALPVSRRQIVTARYLVMVATLLASVIVANVAGYVAGLVFALAQFGVPAFQPFGDALSLDVALMGIFIVYLGIEMPIFFRWGLTKARPFFNAPALLVLLAVLPFLGSVRSMMSTSDLSASGIAQQIGTTLLAPSETPLPLVIAFAVVYLGIAAGAYLVSVRVSRRLYATRDF